MSFTKLIERNLCYLLIKKNGIANLEMERIHILNTPIDNLNMSETIDYISNAIESKKVISHVAINAAKIVSIQTDYELKESVIHADIINADGQAIVWASKFLGQPLKERVTGVDLMEQLVKISFEKSYKIFFLGATEEVIKNVVDFYSKKYSKDIIAGYRNGYFSRHEEREVAEETNKIQILSDANEDFLKKGRIAFPVVILYPYFRIA